MAGWCRAEPRLGHLASDLGGGSPPGSAVSPEPAPAILLWLGRAWLPVLRRLCPSGTSRRYLVDLCRAVDPRVRLVARCTIGSRVARRRAGGTDVACDRPAARSPWRAYHALHCRSGDRHRSDAAVADTISARLLSAVLHRTDELGWSVRSRDLWRRQ